MSACQLRSVFHPTTLQLTAGKQVFTYYILLNSATTLNSQDIIWRKIRLASNSKNICLEVFKVAELIKVFWGRRPDQMSYKIQRFWEKLHLILQGDVKSLCCQLLLLIYPVRICGRRLSAELFHIIPMTEMELVSERLDFVTHLTRLSAWEEFID
jgi:hypothetical protein